MSFSLLLAAVVFSGAFLLSTRTQLAKAVVLARGRRRRMKRRARQWYMD